MRRSFHFAFLAGAALLLPSPVTAQAPAPTSPQYTLRSSSRIVLTDVTVTDAAGNPVRDLPASAFHITDNKQPQTLASFEEHTPSATPYATPVDPAVHTNANLLHPPPVLDILVLDLNHLPIDDQMFLNVELTRLLDRLASGQLLAVYVQHGSFGFFMQDFTTDRKLLQAALRRAIPRFPPPGVERLTDLSTLDQLAQTLAPLPGRKNVLWFSGGAPRLLVPGDPFNLIQQDAVDAQRINDELEAARIAIYPIDARGLFGFSPNLSGAIATQHSALKEVAEATGGEATLDTNGLAAAAIHILDTSQSFYTLTFSPGNLRYDNRWHTLRVTLDRPGLRLSYRRGYFADGRNTTPATGSRPRLLAGGATIATPPASPSSLIFEATVTPAHVATPISEPPLKKGHTRYTIRYAAPASSVTLHGAPGPSRFVVGAAVIAVNSDGHPIARRAQQITIPVNLTGLRVNPDVPLSVEQQIDLPHGDAYLSVAFWDVETGRIGTLTLPLSTPRPAHPAPTQP